MNGWILNYLVTVWSEKDLRMASASKNFELILLLKKGTGPRW